MISAAPSTLIPYVEVSLSFSAKIFHFTVLRMRSDEVKVSSTLEATSKFLFFVAVFADKY